MKDQIKNQKKAPLAVILQRMVRFALNGIFNWGTWWCGIALFVNYNGYPYIGMGCLFLWVLFMILDELKTLNRRVKRLILE